MANTSKIIELGLLFFVLPLSFLLDYPLLYKATLVAICFIYILIILFTKTDTKFTTSKCINWSRFWKHTLIKFIIIALVTTAFVFFKDSKLLFYVPRHKPGLFIIIIGIYSIFSVWPQEIIYRTFFFKRYHHLFPNNTLFILSNAILFSLAHIFFKNWLVLILTFIGGLLFAYTFIKTKSTTLVSIEHALYGNWLFTVGMGKILAFPGIDAS